MSQKVDTDKYDEIQAYAKELYMLPKENGEHKYTLLDIAGKIARKFDVEYTRGTILNWAKKIDARGSCWRSEYTAFVALGLSNPDIDNGDRLAEEGFNDEIAARLKEEYSTTKGIHKNQSFIIESIFRSAAGTIRKIAKDEYENDIDAIPIDILHDRIPPTLIKIITDSEEKMRLRIKSMENIGSSGAMLGVKRLLDNIERLSDVQLAEGLKDEWK